MGKKGFYSLALLILVIILLNDCKKEDSEPKDLIDTSFVIGKPSDNIFINTLDSPIIIKLNSYYLDLDGDYGGEFNFGVMKGISSGGLRIEYLAVEVLNTSIEISYIDIYDTIHVCVKQINDSVTWSTFYNTSSSQFICDLDESRKDSIGYVMYCSYPQVYNSGDTMNLTEKWTNEGLLFKYIDNSYGGYTDSQSWYNNNIIRGTWSYADIKYMLFRINRVNKPYYGWIKMSIDRYSDGVQEFPMIQIFEYAIQIDL